MSLQYLANVMADGKEDHAGAFHEATVERGLPASEYFERAGISASARAHGGLCRFTMSGTPALYQITNAPIADDDALAPSIDLNCALFGQFVGALENHHPMRRAKRRAVESSLGSAKFVSELSPHALPIAEAFLAAAAGAEHAIDEFALQIVAHVDSHVPGVLDLTARPLPDYLCSETHGQVARDFFTIASNVISNNDPAAMEDFDIITGFTRDVLRDNQEALAAAPATNLIRRHFAIWGLPLTRDAIESLDSAKLKELGTVIVATYDTTALSLCWALALIESTPSAKAEILQAAGATPADGELSVFELAAIEALRFGGSNPTALWRRVRSPFSFEHEGKTVAVPEGAMIWLDRWQANRDPAAFPRPHDFDLANVRCLVRARGDSAASLLARSRYEINSFSMVNSHRNPRKCPGRLFSVVLQAVLLREIYSRYAVTSRGIDLRLRRGASMPRPASAGWMTLASLERNGAARPDRLDRFAGEKRHDR